MAAFRIEDLVREAEREVRMRRRVYPRWVADGKMTSAQALERIALMEAIVATLRLQADQLALPL